MDEFIETQKLVRELLEEDIRCRNSDLWLTLMVWIKKQQIKLNVPFDQLHKMIIPETISRVRRDIQNTQGNLLPTDPSVLTRRKFKEEEIKSFYGEDSKVFKEWMDIKFDIK